MKKLTVITVCILWLVAIHGQNYLKQSNFTRELEIGIVEKLGDTIPLNLAFYNENNESVTLGQLINKPTIMCFVYFDCPNLCSPLMSGVADVISKLDMELGVDYQIITISFNTSDTPEKAREKKVNFVNKISKDHQKDWIYLTGTQENISMITEAVGYKYKPQGLDFAHPSAILILSPAGKITRYLYGLAYLPFDVKMSIIESQKGIARPSINRIMEYCFAYNPASKTYTLQVTRIFATVIILVAAILLVVLFLKSRKKSKTNQ